MNRTIKFRGIMFGDIYGKDIVYGEFVHNNGHAYIKAVDGRQYRVYENSVVQLIAVDKNGNEIYEGDFCTCKGAIMNPFLATFDHFAAIRNGKIILVEAHSCEE